MSKSGSSSNPDRVVGKKAQRRGGTPRTKATAKRLKMYAGSGVQRNKAGKVVGGELARRDCAGGQAITGATGRIAPDRRWFGNTRTIGAKELDAFREDVKTATADPRAVILKRGKVPVSLADETVSKGPRRDLLTTEPSFFPKSGARKRPKPLGPNLSSLLARAEPAWEEPPAPDEFKDEARHDLFAKGQSKRIWGELYKVLDCSDVVLHVVDARDVPGTTCDVVVKNLKKNKHLVFVMNKCDLVPNWAVKRWISHLSKTAPALAFRASQTKPFGKGALIDVLRQYAKLHAEAKQISVGIIGYPNVGKSSVVNALRSKAVCKVAPVPGETKVWQYVSLTKRVSLIDSPGVVVGRDDDVDTVLKGVVRAERLPDPTVFLAPLLSRANPDHLRNAYGLALKNDDDDAVDYAKRLALKMGRLLQKGEPDLRTVATMLINDWQRGKIPHFVPPPDDLDDPDHQAPPPPPPPPKDGDDDKPDHDKPDDDDDKPDAGRDESMGARPPAARSVFLKD
ncbi:hypothetical protein CTAYLR_005560 [Chrysophaeum taylorii]|uniref:Nucleolar GTP-binding protein 2 n=1 Tax=Chrysophaeum taylorii TaxID=2483200 RepID=A0AAD7U6A8_9STRA|nr:hypothetical protein CTAYLR_005560 [Chrysophaeum taylorii]